LPHRGNPPSGLPIAANRAESTNNGSIRKRSLRTRTRLVHVCSESHREWLESRLKHGNEISLRQRIKRIIQPYKSLIGNNKRREQLIASIVDTRNYLTHYEERLRVRAASGNDLWDLCMKLEAIFQLLILKELGFEKNEIESILSRNYKLKQKLDNI